jgi:cephalosporin hydroxylase
MAYLEESLELTLRQLIPVIQHRIMNESAYFGVKTLKSPTDFWVYQEIIYETRPDVIIEIGNYCGGSTLALAHLCDCLGHGRVIGVDLSHANVPESVRRHARITLIEGEAVLSFDRVAGLIELEDKVLVIEDSSHTYEHTLQALNTYSQLVKPGGYFIVEDGICHHGLDGGPFPGPFEAVETFASLRADFVIDRSREAFLLTWNPKGYLRKIA